jgi:hypothetical protein
MTFAVFFPMMPICRIPIIVVMNFPLDAAFVLFSVVTIFFAIRPGSGGKHQQQDTRQNTDDTYFRFHWPTSFVLEVV